MHSETPEHIDPRIARTRCAVIEATRSLLCEGGYSAVNFDAVSKRAGVARTTIYRHWSSVAELVHAAAVTALDHHEPADTGNVRDDVRRELEGLAGHISAKGSGRLIPVIVDAASRDSEMLSIQRRFAADRLATMTALIQRAVERGELPGDLDLEIFTEQLVGPIFFRVLVSHQPADRRYLDRLVAAAFAAM